MQTFTRPAPVALDQLADELADELGLAEPPAVGLRHVEGDPELVVQVDVDDDQADAAAAVVAAHVAAPATDPESEFRGAVEAATTLHDLKAALLGANGRGPGAQPRRGRPA